MEKVCIIPYQELLGNYDLLCVVQQLNQIIPYQELLGNYDASKRFAPAFQLYHTKSY